MTCDHATSYARTTDALRRETAKPKSRWNRRIIRAAGAVLVTLEAERATCPTCIKETR